MAKKVSFVEFERQRLLDLVGRHKDIIQSRHTDSTSLHRKQVLWERITQEYNRHPNVRKRQTHQLKRLWQNTTARAKRAAGTNTSTDNNINKQPTTTIRSNEVVAAVANTSVAGGDHQIPDSFEDIFDDTVYKNHRLETVDSEQQQPTEDLQHSADEGDDSATLSQYLSPIIAARLRKIEDSIVQQRELHQAQMQREQIQCKGAQEEIQRLAELHAHQVERERELADIRISLEKELHLQRMRHEQELHQLKLNEYNKVQAASYQIMYKQ